MSSTPRNAMGSRQTVSSELTPREFHPSDGLPEPPSLPATVLSRSDCDWTGVSLSSLWVMAKSGAARYFESAFVAHHLSSLTACRQVLAHRCTRLCSSQLQRESIWRMSIRLSRNNPVFATQRKTGWEDFCPLTQ